MRILLAMSLVILAACGSDKKSDDDRSQAAPETASQVKKDGKDKKAEEAKTSDDPSKSPEQTADTPTDEQQTSPVQESDVTQPAPILVPAAPFISGQRNELPGLYQLPENPEVRLMIDSQFLMSTNITLAGWSRTGMAEQLSLSFPQHLRAIPFRTEVTTLGFVMTESGIRENVEIEILAQPGTNFIDVTFILPSEMFGNNDCGPSYDPCDPCDRDPCRGYNDPCDRDPCRRHKDPCQVDPCQGYYDPCQGAPVACEQQLPLQRLYRLQKVEEQQALPPRQI